jgi:hypothetical protein
MEPRWALLIRIVCRRTSFEPHLGEIPASQQLVRKPDGQKPTAGTSRANPPGPQTLRIIRGVALATQSGTSGVAVILSNKFHLVSERSAGARRSARIGTNYLASRGGSPSAHGRVNDVSTG